MINIPTTKNKEKHINERINKELTTTASKLNTKSIDLVNKYKDLNDQMNYYIRLEKDLNIKENNLKSQKIELLNLERRLKEKNNMKVDLLTVFDCYLTILKNNEELLNQRIDNLKERSSNILIKEYILSKVQNKNPSAINTSFVPLKDTVQEKKPIEEMIFAKNDEFTITSN